jgi:hypothetical protein
MWALSMKLHCQIHFQRPLINQLLRLAAMAYAASYFDSSNFSGLKWISNQHFQKFTLFSCELTTS